MDKVLVSACLLGTPCRYDGTFSRRLAPGDGVTAGLLKAHGIKVYGESGLSAPGEDEK